MAETALPAQPVPAAGARSSMVDKEQPMPALIPAEHRISIASRLSDSSVPGPGLPVPVADDRGLYNPGQPPAQLPAAHRISIAYSSASSVPGRPSVDQPQNAVTGAGSTGIGGLPPGFNLPISWGPPVSAFQDFAQEPARVTSKATTAASPQRPPGADQPAGQRMQTVASAQPVLMNGDSGGGPGTPLARQNR